MDGEVLTARDVAAILKCSRSKIYALQSRGELRPRFKIFDGEKGWRWHREDVQRFLSDHTMPGFEPVDIAPPFVRVTHSQREAARRT